MHERVCVNSLCFPGAGLPEMAGYWRDPAHSIEWRGPLTNPGFIAEAMLYPEGEAQNHITVGAGLAWPRFQIDAAYDSSDHYKVGSISVVTRF